MKPFVLLASQRTGSTWVMDMLCSHPAIVGYGELFIEGGRSSPRFTGAKDIPHYELFLNQWDASPAEEADRGLWAYLDNLYRARAGIEAVGFKLMHGQAGAYPAISSYLSERGVSIVHLLRRNLLDVLVSKESAVARDQFHARAGEHIEEVTVNLGTPKLMKRLEESDQRVRRVRRRFSALGVPYAEVEYEQLVTDPGEFLKILRFLDVQESGVKLTSDLLKLNSRESSAIIGNHDAVVRELSGTRFAWMLASKTTKRA